VRSGSGFWGAAFSVAVWLDSAFSKSVSYKTEGPRVTTIYSQARQSGSQCYFVGRHWFQIQLEQVSTLVAQTDRLWEA
jgi:hypothetical protein